MAAQENREVEGDPIRVTITLATATAFYSVQYRRRQ